MSLMYKFNFLVTFYFFLIINAVIKIKGTMSRILTDF